MKKKGTDSEDSPINFEEELEPIRKKTGLSRVGRVLGRSVVTVFRSTTPDAVKDVWKLARWETQNVRCWRTLIFFLLLITGAFVSSYTYIFLRREQDSDFEDNVSVVTRSWNFYLARPSFAISWKIPNSNIAFFGLVFGISVQTFCAQNWICCSGR